MALYGGPGGGHCRVLPVRSSVNSSKWRGNAPGYRHSTVILYGRTYTYLRVYSTSAPISIPVSCHCHQARSLRTVQRVYQDSGSQPLRKSSLRTGKSRNWGPDRRVLFIGRRSTLQSSGGILQPCGLPLNSATCGKLFAGNKLM